MYSVIFNMVYSDAMSVYTTFTMYPSRYLLYHSDSCSNRYAFTICGEKYLNKKNRRIAGNSW